MVRLNLSLNDLKNWKGIFNSAYTRVVLFEKSKETDKFKVSKTHKSA